MTRSQLITLAAFGSAALLLGAFAFQHLGGLAPCAMCIWQRYPHAVAVICAGLALLLGGRIFLMLGGLAVVATGGIGVYHTGVERGWWEGPSTCTSGPVGDLSTDELMDQIMAAPLVRCDEVPWELLSLSMASWNTLLSLGLLALWLLALRAPAR
ncbi:disulfide bond formation protein B [Thalassococcus sp. S3]|uniref:disulfide bond formation protein B n=1 Tax=Thalassococcus sp. S3 TaxID=2017482 RepID=UPI0010247927|nr:disulfide bond formation protein B [Thalassococcus sp. S3]QBF31654.1 disulfide bond formation protein B [Thalassococcus sp. S3]